MRGVGRGLLPLRKFRIFRTDKLLRPLNYSATGEGFAALAKFVIGKRLIVKVSFPGIARKIAAIYHIFICKPYSSTVDEAIEEVGME